MTIDNCQYTFSQLNSNVLSSHMKRMRRSIVNFYPMALFGTKGFGPKSILQHLDRSRDFAGCYVFLENTDPIYVGISRAVVQRLSQHVKGRTHYDASLAYKIACENQTHGLKREAAMKERVFKKKFRKAQAYLNSLNVAFIEIHNDLELYLFEVYCAMALNTSKWNTFRTH